MTVVVVEGSGTAAPERTFKVWICCERIAPEWRQWVGQ